MTPSRSYFTLDISIHRMGESYVVELAHADPQSQARVAPLRGHASFDPEALAQKLYQPEDYGRQLAAQLFAEPEVKQRFLQVEQAVQAADGWLRISLRFDPSAQELHLLRWELLRHPDTGALLATSERVLLSRFMVSRDWRPVKLRARTDLRALIAISAPPAADLARSKLAPVDFEGEMTRARKALEGIRVQILGGPEAPFTIGRLIDALRDGVDILYLVSHGMFSRRTGTPALFLQKDDGGLQVVTGDDLATRVGELQSGPRLAVLASCQSAGDGADAEAGTRPMVQATLAGRLADVGVPAVIAMQGLISMTSVEQMMPVLFRELLQDGQIDRALSAARGAIRDRHDCWMPALYLRLTDGCIWYTPGFGGEREEQIWKDLIRPVQAGKLVPILGSGLLEQVCGTSFDIARQLAERHSFPLADHQWDDLPRVTQYLSVTQSRFNVVEEYKDQLARELVARHRHWLPAAELPPAGKKPKLGKLLGLVAEHQRAQDHTDPFNVLAGLPASVYLTTNFDPLLTWALRDKERPPRRLLSRWRYHSAPCLAEDTGGAELTAREPLVYHLLGAFGKDTDDTLVLTEDDYFDYLIGTSSDRLIPPEVESSLVDNSLLFLGFRLTDWSFRVLFRLIMSLPGRERLKDYCHVAVQVDPELHSMADLEGAKAYLAKYFDQEANIAIYWGSAAEFLRALHDELLRAGDLIPAVEEDEEDDDEWD